MLKIKKTKRILITLLLLVCLLTTACSNYRLVENKKYSWETGVGEKLMREYREKQEKRKQHTRNLLEHFNEDYETIMHTLFMGF